MDIQTMSQLFTYFIVYAFLGWILEVVYHLFTNRKFINRGFLFGPVCPIYGFGAVILIVLLEHLGDSSIAIFVGGAFFASVLEYITGYLLEKLFHQKWWDYSQMRYNLNGYISLGFSIIWGFVSLFLVKILHPFVLSILNKIPSNIMNILVPSLFIVIALDTFYTVMSLVEFKKVLEGLKEVKYELHQKYDSLTKLDLEEARLREERINKRLKESIELRLNNKPVRFKNTHIKLLKSYPNLANNEWVKRLKDSLRKGE